VEIRDSSSANAEIGVGRHGGGQTVNHNQADIDFRRGGTRSMSDSSRHVGAFSTDMLPARERFEHFREEVARKMIRIDVAEWREAPLRAHLRSMRLGGVSFLEAHCSPVVLTRSRELIGDGNDDLGLFISLASSFHCDFVDRTLGQGEVALTDNSRAASIVCSGGGSFFALSMPRKALMSLAPDAEDRLKRPAVDGDRPELRLLRNYLETLLTSSAVNAATLHAAGAHVLDLVALALGAAGEAGHAASAGGLRAARALAVRQSVSARLRNPKLSPADIAKANGVSERYLRLLFAEMGTSFSEFLNAQRLELALRLLASPLHRNRRIAEIAFEAGFSDLSHFNRRFRARFHMTPSAAREEARGPALNNAR
jgi:AraC-like DNA-binding protein